MALSIKDIKTKLGGFFQRKLKNLITLGNDSTLESDLKPIKVGDNNTPIEVSETEVRVSGTINADAINVGGSAVQTGTDAGATELNELSDVTYSSGDLTITSLDTIVSGALTFDSSADIKLDVAGADVYFAYNGTNVGQINTGSVGKFRIIGTTDYSVNIISQGTGDILLSSADDITIDAADTLTIDTDGTYIMMKDGTEFSAANSAYAGMILGYTCIGLNETHTGYNLTTSFVVPTDEFGVTFTAPPSGNVEIYISIRFDAGSSGAGTLVAGLSTANATSGYSGLEDYHEEGIIDPNVRAYVNTIQHTWTLTGLTAGTSYTYYVGFKTASTTGTPHIEWGGTSSERYPDFIMKATALPATIAT